MNWKELLKAFIDKLEEQMKGKSAEERKKLLAEATADLPAEVRQHLFDDGHATATRDAKTKTKDLEDKVKAAEDALKEKDTEIEKLRSEKPDVDAVRREYEQKLSDKEAKHNSEMEKVQGDLRTTRLAGARAQLAAALSTLVHPEIAEARIIKAEQAGRLKVDDKTGEVRFYGEDGATPLQVPAGKTAADVLAAEIAQSVPAEFRKTTAGGGPGERDGSGGSGDASLYDGIRKEAGAQGDAKQEEALDTLAYS